MKFSYNHLQNYFPNPLPPADEIANRLGLHSFELEGVEMLENGDVVIDWDILPNRSSDCLCYDGIVSEIATVFDIEHRARPPMGEYSTDIKTSDKLELIVEADGVSRATKRYMENVTVGESPEWLVNLLAAHGMKSVNNVVDMTTAVMLDTGQPIHAFDYDKLAGEGVKKIVIRNAQPGEVVKDLHGGTHELDETMVVIADLEKALDVAGIKGGANSGVDESTTRVVISACAFDYENIRNTSKKLKLQTDASKRFENEVPITKIDWAQETAAMMMDKQFDATVSHDFADTNPGPFERNTLSVSLAAINDLLGINLGEDEVLSLLGCVCDKASAENGEISVTVPSHRTDLNIPEDLIEEVGRLYGYENIPETPVESGFHATPENPIKKAQYTIIDTLVSLGFYEIYNRTITTDGAVKLKNPFTSELDSLRSHLGTGLLERAEKNLAHTDEPRLFEIGTIFEGIEGEQVQEALHWAGVIGRRKIKEKQKNDLFLQTKGVIETVMDALDTQLEWENYEASGSGAIATVSINGEKVGIVGVNWWEINLSLLVPHLGKTINYKKPSKYPSISRDIAFFVPTEVTIKEARELISKELPDEAISLELFDVFEREHDKSLAFRIVFQSHQETLSDEFANTVMEKVNKMLTEKSYEVR